VMSKFLKLGLKKETVRQVHQSAMNQA
jgi:hypothetical protein